MSNAMAPRLLEGWLAPFRGERGLSKPVLLLFVAINAVVLWNAVAHDARIGYDAGSHLAYIEALSSGHLPTQRQTYEYFTPPLPYLIPALIRAAGVPLLGAAKVAQLLNVLYSLILTWCLLRVADRLRPHDASLKIRSLGLLGMLPVYYKSFAFIRPEPLVACLAVVMAKDVIHVMLTEAQRLRHAVKLGVVMGLLILARQWGFLLVGAMMVFSGLVMLKQAVRRTFLLKAVLSSLFVAALVGGWFYVHLAVRYGSPLVCAAVPYPTLSLANRPRSFYTALSLERIFQDPIRPLVPPEQFVPVFYSELWGDFEGYFTVYARDRRTGRSLSGFEMESFLARSPEVPAWMDTNRFTINRYLGRVNLVSIVPSLVLCGGFLFGMACLWRMIRHPSASERDTLGAWLALGIFCTAGGYAWFVVRYLSPGSPVSMVKATYVLQAFPFLALLAAEWLQPFRARHPMGYRWLMVSLALVALHNVPACLTRHTSW